MPTSVRKERPAPIVEENPELAQVVYRNIRALLGLRQRAEQRKRTQDRIADAITAFTGSLPFVYLHALLFGGWIVLNLGWIPGVRPFDPFPFVMLAMLASVEAIFLATFVLISQNRMQALADRRADLDLQINLLAEHEVTRLIRLVKRMAQRMGIDESDSPDLPELERDVQPEKVLDEMGRA